MASEMGPETIRKLHADEPVTLTNTHARQAMDSLRATEREWASKDGLSPKESLVNLQHAQVQATLAVAQEIKNLRTAMYGEGN